jgi:hypothetical protein
MNEQITVNPEVYRKAYRDVYRKLGIARQRLRGQILKKSGHNKFAGYNYFELGDFLHPTLNIFDDLGLIGIVSFTKEQAELCIVDLDGGGEIVITSPFGSAALKGCHEVQNIGAVETYQRRYLWVTAMEIVEHDALDSTTGSGNIETIDVGMMIDHLAAIDAASTLEELKNVYSTAYAHCGGDKGWQKKVIDAKEKRKGALK